MTRGQGKSILELLAEIEPDWPSRINELSDKDLGDLLERWDRSGKILSRQQQLRIEQKGRLQETYTGASGEDGIPSEVLRQVVPFLTAPEAGRLFVVSCKTMLERVGSETIWRDICQKTWPTREKRGEGKASDVMDRAVVASLGSYKNYFRQRQKTILLAQEDSNPILPTPMTSKTNKMCLVFDVWKGSPQKNLISDTFVDLEELWEQASITLEISAPIRVATLPRQRAHGWDIPTFFDNDGRARLQLFRLGLEGEAPSSSSTAIANSPVLLDTTFGWWRGWPNHGEVTFIQRERTVGLQLTDRGQWIQHRIAQCRHPRWMSYLGLQFKVVLLCERMAADSQDAEFVNYGFTKVRIEAIRLHENSNGNVQHHLFRKDQGWQKHGVTLSHLLEELC